MSVSGSVRFVDYGPELLPGSACRKPVQGHTSGHDRSLGQKIERIRAILKGRHRIDRHITSGPISREPILTPRILPKPLSTPTKISTSIKGGNLRVRRADAALTAGINAGLDRPRKKGLWGSGGTTKRGQADASPLSSPPRRSDTQ